MAKNYETYINYYEDLWYTLGQQDNLNDRVNTTPFKDQSLRRFKKDIIRFLKEAQKKEGNGRQEDSIVELKTNIIAFLSDPIGLDKAVCHTLDDEGYFQTTVDFYNEARRSCPDMAFSDINQALRNMWVVMALQLYLGEEIRLTNAAFAYSMLYPLTDNYMDDTSISNATKKSFNQRFFNKIKYGDGIALNELESRIFHMIDLIESDYNRLDYPEVFQSLLAILDAQNLSLAQQSMAHPFTLNLLRQTIYKGGSSVLADAYLVKGTLTEDECLFAFGYGVALQLADDFEDVDEDTKSHHMTLPSFSMKSSTLDALFEHYILFFDYILDKIMAKDTPKRSAMNALLKTSKTYLLLNNVYNNPRHFSPSFTKHYQDKSLFSKKAFLAGNKKIAHLISVLQSHPKFHLNE